MYKQVSFVITAAIMLTAFVTIALYTGSETAHAAIIVMKKTNMTVTPAGGANMTNATAGGANMTK
jgi:hypothetical protein